MARRRMHPTPGEHRGPTLRTQRLRLVWLVVLPFLFLARPSPRALLAGAIFSLAGLSLRALAAGSIHKDRELATGGAYRRVRHPLYLGSFLLGFGLAFAGGIWWFPMVFTGLFVWLYGRTIRAEERGLEIQFGQDYLDYRKQVPAFFPRRQIVSSQKPSPGFRWWLYQRNKEWQAALGTLVGYGLLWARMSLLG